jgi:FkbM family methyltransferase
LANTVAPFCRYPTYLMSNPKPPSSPAARTALRAGVFAAVTTVIVGFIGIALAVATYFYPPLFLLGLGLLNRKPMCANTEVLRGAETHRLGEKYRLQLEGAARLIQKDPAGYNLWETPRGRWWIPAGSDKFLPALLAQQQSKIYGSGSSGVQSGDIVLDCGSHIGVYTREALDSGAKLVVAIEPAPANLECFRRNMSREIAAGRVIVYPKGVWDKEDMLVLNEDPNNTAADSFVVQAEHNVAVPKIALTTIDLLVAELKLPKVDMIKMDIKGATQRALTGGKGTLTRNKPRIAISTEETEDNPKDVAAFIDAMGLGYRVECGTCSMSSLMVHPDVLLFH